MTLYIHGASGRLGRLITAECLRLGLDVADLDAALDGSSPRYPTLARLAASHGNERHGIIDVTLPEGSTSLAEALLERQAALLDKFSFLIIGTTGHSADQNATLNALAKKLALVRAPNFSRGVFFLQEMLQARTPGGKSVAELARELGFDLGLVDIHHALKRDAPSGTALALAAAANIESAKITSLRVGNVIGEHTIALSGDTEEIRISHLAGSRQLFASGAVTLAQRLALNTPPPGIYTMAEIMRQPSETKK